MTFVTVLMLAIAALYLWRHILTLIAGGAILLMVIGLTFIVTTVEALPN